jgi:NADPH-dependent 2,4-dienoyl-CoA reductase/sulfur reductase-like enzyme
MSTAHVIVGASLAGAKAAETLREEGFDGPIALIGEEEERPYERPSLSKDYLLGKAERETIYVHPQAWYADHGVDQRLGTLVTRVDPLAHEVTLADGSLIDYGKPAWRSATGSWSTPGCGPQNRTSTPRGTWRTPTIRCSAGTSGSSTGPTR